MFKLFVILVVIAIITNSEARKNHLEVRDDYRRYIPLSTFGFYQYGILDVQIKNFILPKANENDIFGLSLDRTLSDAMNNAYLDIHQEQCILQEPGSTQHGPIIFFLMDFKNNLVHLNCSKDWEDLHIYEDRTKYNSKPLQNLQYPMPRFKRFAADSEAQDFQTSKQKRSSVPEDNPYESHEMKACPLPSLPMTHTSSKDKSETYYSFKFVLAIESKLEEGLYNLYFHSCPNYKDIPTFSMEFDVDIEEMNKGNYLSAGEMPLPALYFMMSLIFFLSGLFWVFILRKTRHPVFKIHYLMAVLVFLKSLSLMFHSINFHFIEIKGEHVEAWAILFYITHLMKGAVLFTTIVLIGTGWTFIKHILGDKDKKLFMIVIPLQVIANVAQIIIDESQIGDKEHGMWRNIFNLVDLLCCAAILFPVVWSIRHLQEASATDGKAAINLKKLKLFRQFYIMIVCYIYFTRIIVYLLKITVAFQFAWLDEMFKEMATYVFFVLTAYKFRPTEQHIYFNLRDLDDDDEEDEVEVLTQTGLTENLRNITNRTQQTTTEELYVEEKESLINKRESSHEYD